jgi:hypothetical protein
MTAKQHQIEALHSEYVRLTGMDVPLSMPRLFTWEVFQHRGFGLPELNIVVPWLRKQIKTGPKTVKCLGFRALIEDCEAFEEHLSFARAESRIRRPDPARASILRTTGRDPNPVQGEARPARNIIAEMTALNELRALKESL